MAEILLKEALNTKIQIQIPFHYLDQSNVFNDMFWSGIYIKDN